MFVRDKREKDRKGVSFSVCMSTGERGRIILELYYIICPFMLMLKEIGEWHNLLMNFPVDFLCVHSFTFPLS